MIVSGHRRVVSAVAAGTFAALVFAGCSSTNPGGPPVKPSSTPRTGTSTGTAGPPPTTDAATVNAVTSAYEKFFDPKTPLAVSISLLQDGPAFRAAVEQQSKGSLAQKSAAKVSKVTLQSPNTAKVVFSILVSGTALLKDQPGYAVRESGTWKVAGQTFCGLLTLQGSPPPACQTPTATTLPG